MKFLFTVMVAAWVLLITGSCLHAQVAFAPVVSYSVGAAPVSIATADVNGDGKIDLICANDQSDTLSVLTNKGSGSFAIASSPSVGNLPDSVTTADVNGDGRPDLISGNFGAGTLSVLTNSGNGSFPLATSPVVGNNPSSVVAVDVNADGKPDLISANWDADTLSVLTNNGSGGFALAASPAVGDGPNCVTTADVNGDGKPDLISANINWMNGVVSNSLSVLTNNGNGGFLLASTPFPGEGAYSVTAADVNGDGKVDLITSDTDAKTLSVLTNNGNSNFMLAASPSVTGHPVSVTTADVNGDGMLDLICTYYSLVGDPPGLNILTNNGNGSFLLAYSLAVDNNPLFNVLMSVTAVDLNGDGRVDLICANQIQDALLVLINIPTLTIHRSTNSVIVSWSSSWTNWVLQQNSNLATTNWTASSGIFDNGTNKSLTVTQPTGNLFFRLYCP